MKAAEFLALCEWIKAATNQPLNQVINCTETTTRKGGQQVPVHSHRLVSEIRRASTIHKPKTSVATDWRTPRGAAGKEQTLQVMLTGVFEVFHQKHFDDKEAGFVNERLSQENFITIFRFFWKQPKNLNPEGKAEVPKITWLNFSLF